MFNDAFIVREILIFMAQQPVGGQGLLIFEASRSHVVIHTTFGRNPLDE
jgi:hypothetical protein